MDDGLRGGVVRAAGVWVMSKFFNQLNNIKAGRAKVRAYGEGGTVDALESARDYLKEKYNNPEAGIPTKVATVLGLLPVNLARSAARAVTAPTRSMTDENFNPEEEAANMAGFITTGGIGLSKAGLGPKGDVLGMGVAGKKPNDIIPHGDPVRVENLSNFLKDKHPEVPDVLYHASPKWEGNAYDPSQKTINRSGNVAGFYAGTEKTRVDQYTKDWRNESGGVSEGAEIMPVHMAIKNPFFPGRTEISPEMMAVYTDELRKKNPHLSDSADWVGKKVKELTERKAVSQQALNGDGWAYQRVLRAGGYDGMKDGSAWIAFDPTQIKSAIGNEGTFNPTNPNLKKAHGGAVHQRALGAKLFGLK